MRTKLGKYSLRIRSVLRVTKNIFRLDNSLRTHIIKKKKPVIFIIIVYDNERTQVKISKEMVDGQRPAATRRKPLGIPCQWECTYFSQKNVITHVKCCPPGKLTMLGCPGISLGFSPRGIHLPGVCSRIQSPLPEEQ